MLSLTPRSSNTDALGWWQTQPPQLIHCVQEDPQLAGLAAVTAAAKPGVSFLFQPLCYTSASVFDKDKRCKKLMFCHKNLRRDDPPPQIMICI